MVGRAYLLDKPAPPSPAHRFATQVVTPVLIDAAAAVEGELQRLSTRTREAPYLAFGLACALGGMLSLLAGRRR